MRQKNKDKYGDVKQDNLEKSLDNNTGNGKTTVTYYQKGAVYLVTFKDSERTYSVTAEGNVKYIGDKESLPNTGIITATPLANLTPEVTQEVKIIRQLFFYSFYPSLLLSSSFC